MKVVSWNVNGLRAVLRSGGHQDLRRLLDSLGADIICFQETKATRVNRIMCLRCHLLLWISFNQENSWMNPFTLWMVIMPIFHFAEARRATQVCLTHPS